VKIYVDGRVIVDPATFRYINLNYFISIPKSEDKDILNNLESYNNNKSESNLDKEGEYYII